MNTHEYQAYEKRSFNRASRALLNTLVAIVESYRTRGLTMTARQAYYQLVARDLIPNSEASYQKICNLLKNARLAGLLPWSAFEDRTREIQERAHWQSPREIIEAAVNNYHEDQWQGQPCRPIVVIEKDALSGIVGPVCRRYDVPLLAARGYPSVTTLREMAVNAITPAQRSGQMVAVLHLGDHDPSGLDMSRDLKDRLALFSEETVYFYRLALNRDQVDELRPPPNPAKLSDKRAAAYVKQHGPASWELDALPPDYLTDLVEDNIKSLIDFDTWKAIVAKIESAREHLRTFAAGLH